MGSASVGKSPTSSSQRSRSSWALRTLNSGRVRSTRMATSSLARKPLWPQARRPASLATEPQMQQHETARKRTARRDAPIEACELGAVIADDELGLAAERDDGRELPSDALARDRGVDHGGGAFLRDVVDDVEDPQRSAIGKLVMLRKSMDQRAFGRAFVRSGARVPVARLRPRRFLTVRPSPR